MIQLLPSSYNQKRTVTVNYEVLANIYHSRKNHKLDEWREFCSWIETLPYFKEICLSKPQKYDPAMINELIENLKMDNALTIFDPLTGMTTDPENLNDLNKFHYSCNERTINILRALIS